MNDNSNNLDDLLKNYHPNEKSIEAVKTTPLVLLVGISGAGKGTIRERLFASGEYTNFISHTTRAPRENNGIMEQDGVEYHFVSIEKAVDMIKNGEFIEAKHYSGNIYGTTVAELLKAKQSGKIALNDVEIQGIGEYLAPSNSVKAIFIVPPSYDIWMERLLKRYAGRIDENDFRKRLATAKNELETTLADNRCSFIINDDLDTAVQDVENIVKHGSHDDSAARKVAAEILDRINEA